VDPGPHGAELDPEGGRDLLVRQALDVAEDHGRAEVGRQRVERGLHVRVEGALRIDLLGTTLPARQALGVVGQRVEPDALAATDHVQEQVRGDPVQPTLERAGGVVGQRPEDANERLLGQVLGVLLVAGQPVGKAVDPAVCSRTTSSQVGGTHVDAEASITAPPVSDAVDDANTAMVPDHSSHADPWHWFTQRILRLSVLRRFQRAAAPARSPGVSTARTALSR
jgi:hypothetical protein